MYRYIVSKTLTYAQRISRLLDSNRIISHIKRLPSELREKNGCGYAVRVDAHDLDNAVDLTLKAGITPLRVYSSIENGGEEVKSYDIS